MAEKKDVKSTDDIELLKVPTSNIAYANVIHWGTIFFTVLALFAPLFMLIDQSSNLLNPSLVFGAIFNGTSVSEIWKLSTTGSFPGAHFYLNYIGLAESWGQIAICGGCAIGLFALAPTILIQVFKEKSYVQAFLGLIFFALILFSAIGVLSIDAG
ncbi:MAG: hypothetical protein R2876_06095 [Eubacteriales bacterium]